MNKKHSEDIWDRSNVCYLYNKKFILTWDMAEKSNIGLYLMNYYSYLWFSQFDLPHPLPLWIYFCVEIKQFTHLTIKFIENSRKRHVSQK